MNVSRAIRLIIAVALSTLTISIFGCGRNGQDLVIISNKDKSIEVIFFKDTALMHADEDDKIKRVGIQGYSGSKGETTRTYFGIECGAGGGVYVELSTDRDRDDGLVLFTNEKWVRGGERFLDHVAEEGCKIGQANSD